MIRLIVSDSFSGNQSLTFSGNAVTIGRGPKNSVVLTDPGVSKYHGRLTVVGDGFLYEDLYSTNGTRVRRDGAEIQLGREGTRQSPLGPGDLIHIASHTMRLVADHSTTSPDERDDPVTVAFSVQLDSVIELQANLISADPKIASRFLELVGDTASALRDDAQLADILTRFIFEAFPTATHLTLGLLDLDGGQLQPFIAQARDGSRTLRAWSRTIVNRVLSQEQSLLFSHAQDDLGESESVARSRIETAICAPLAGSDQILGVLQLDIRAPGKGVFARSDLDLLTVLASHIGLVLDNRRLYDEQRRALHSTINALVHSLSLKDPESAYHSERVQAVSMAVGREIGLNGEDLEVLSTASILHDMGKHATPDEILFKPTSLTPAEFKEISNHAAYSQGILDKIRFPRSLKQVPVIAAYHHEKIDGSGTFGIKGDQIPLLSRIVAVADVFDALASARAYKEPKSLREILAILDDGRDTLWDGEVIDVIKQLASRIVPTIYPPDSPVVRSLPETVDLGGQDQAAA